ncbi:type 2 lanthipeptide synthetase LanM family protein [Amycolatopsis sp. 195334CR]|uniref:type 2 lanthipeptide synthetase LanM family protein n=1 Tax=Amycolatopsis sp. 195334CR TaxID=2814588 RepID=UPI001A8D3E11|nr:type 2 lanthipeptide synthetase LanM family protein [Amycolatopsis sp. 195334CR]MBN6033677.1 type 2 lantipeptide synthetase LanM family protein [Amycolatopsis sp. 195334CR]
MLLSPETPSTGADDLLASWRAALDPGERATAGADHDPAGLRRQTRWAELLGPDAGAVEAALGALGLSPAGLAALLGTVPQPVEAGLPDWAVTTDTALSRSRTSEGPHLADPAKLGLLRPVAEVIRGFQAELHTRLGALVADGPGALASLPELLVRDWPREELTTLVVRTMVLELNVARVEERLRGETAEDRFAHFIGMMGRPETQAALWQEYPVLLRMVHDELTAWSTSRHEFVQRLVADFEELPALLPGHPEPGAVLEVGFGAGDRHRGGRTVAIVRFDHGRVVYKPRSLAVDREWASVLTWFAGQRPPHDLRTPAVLLGDGYGWSEFVEHDGCATPAEASAFYWRTGALLALLHAFCANDVHLENLIANGAYPVLIDLESLFHGALPAHEEQVWADPAADLLTNGVLSIGLLPNKLMVRGMDGPRVLETSAVAADGDEQPSLLPVPVPEAVGTDEMHFVERHVSSAMTAGNRPHLDGRQLDPCDYRDEVVAGFSWAYRAIVADRDSWSAADGLIRRFRSVPLRHIARATMIYVRTLQTAQHPDFLRDAMDRELVYARLAVGADGTGPWERLVPSELADLRRGDVPFFEVRSGTRHLWDSTGTLIEDYLPQAPEEHVLHRIAGLDEDDLERQLKLIHRSFDSLQVQPVLGALSGILPLDREPVTAEQATDEAVRLAEELCAEAIGAPGEAGWVVLNFIDERVWQVGSAPMDLYSGVPGIGLFLSAAAAVTGAGHLVDYAERTADRVADYTRRTTDHILREVAKNSALRDGLTRHADPGVFGPAGSLIYYLSHAGAWLERADLLDAAEHGLDLLHRHLAHDQKLDVIGGGAGAILAALALHRVRPAGGALAVAEAAAESLLARQTTDGGWPSPLGPRPLLGMSHGASGILSALTALHAAAPRPEYATAIANALRYEHGLFDASASNWPDLRPLDMGGSGGCMVAWCHGAPGVGFSRLALLRQRASFAGTAVAPLLDQAAADLEAAVVSTEAAHYLPGGGFGSSGNNCLCHGDLGNLEFLLAAARHVGDVDAEQRHLRAVRALCERATHSGWATGQLPAEALPGLMYGRAGIGYALLRVAAPGRVPSLLELEAPRSEHVDER